MPNPTPASVTPTRRLADALLDGGLDAYVKDRRDEGWSWRRISQHLNQKIKVDVTEKTLMSWFPELRRTDDREAS